MSISRQLFHTLPTYLNILDYFPELQESGENLILGSYKRQKRNNVSYFS